MTLRVIAAAWCLLAALAGPAQTVRFAGSVRAGETFRQRIGRGLVLVMTTDGIAVQPASGGVSDNYATCATPPAHGPNPLDIEGWHFDPARSEGAPGPRREFRFALTGESDKAMCASAAVSYHDDELPGYRRQPLGKGVVTLSRVKLSDSRDDVASLRFRAVVTLPRIRKP